MRKTKQAEEAFEDNPLYHNTWKLLSKYRDVVWSLELSVQQVKKSFEMEFKSSIDEFLESIYSAGAEIQGTMIEHHAKCIEKSNKEVANYTAFVHDLNRPLKNGRPFMIMENTPSLVNWKRVNNFKRPGMHYTSAMQAIAHGADTIQYFQWRKSRGASEKFHGAVVDHEGSENTRVFREVSELGYALNKLDEVVGAVTNAEVAVIYDWENAWALEDIQALSDKKEYEKTSVSHYKYLMNMVSRLISWIHKLIFLNINW